MDGVESASVSGGDEPSRAGVQERDAGFHPWWDGSISSWIAAHALQIPFSKQATAG